MNLSAGNQQMAGAKRRVRQIHPDEILTGQSEWNDGSSIVFKRTSYSGTQLL